MGSPINCLSRARGLDRRHAWRGPQHRGQNQEEMLLHSQSDVRPSPWLCKSKFAALRHARRDQTQPARRLPVKRTQKQRQGPFCGNWKEERKPPGRVTHQESEHCFGLCQTKPESDNSTRSKDCRQEPKPVEAIPDERSSVTALQAAVRRACRCPRSSRVRDLMFPHGRSLLHLDAAWQGTGKERVLLQEDLVLDPQGQRDTQRRCWPWQRHP